MVFIDGLVNDLLPLSRSQVQRVEIAELRSDDLTSFVSELTDHSLKLSSLQRFFISFISNGVASITFMTSIALPVRLREVDVFHARTSRSN